MKILYLNSNYKGEGTYNRCFRIARQLVKKGAEVTLITITSEPPQKQVIRKKESGVDLIELPALSRRRDYLGYILRPRVAKRIALQEKFDLVHAFTAAEPVVWYPARALHRKRQTYPFPLVVDWDDWYSRGGLVELKPFRRILEPRTTYWEESLPLMADDVTVVSKALEERTVKLGVPREKVHLIGNGGDPEIYERLDQKTCREKWGLSPDATLVLYMGMYNQAAPIAIKAFFEAVKDRKDVHFLCLGEISIRHHHLQQEAEWIEKAKRDPRFHMLGRIAEGRVPEYLTASDILLLPMRDTIVEQARFPIRLGDYLASGKAIIASQIGEVGRILKEFDCGLLAQDEPEFARRLSQLIDDPERRAQLGFLARRVAKNQFSWETIAGQMMEVYQTLV